MKIPAMAGLGPSIEVPARPGPRLRERARRLALRALVAVAPRITANRVELGRRAAALYGSAAVLVLATLAFPNPGADLDMIAAVAGTAGIIAAFVGRWSHRIPSRVYPLLSLLATALISVLVRAGGDHRGAYTFLYVWVAVYSFHFYGRRHAAVQVALIAVGAVASAPDPFGFHDIMVVGTVAVVGLWLDDAVSRIRLLAGTDALTGIANRRAWDEELPRRLASARRSRQSLCVAMLDLDHFKQLNDRWGHPAGDAVLAAAVKAWLERLRPSDLLARYGGEEFALVLPGCDDEQALTIVDRVRTAGDTGVSCSAGLARWDGVEAAQSLVARADEALYAAKRRGRDRTVVHPGAALTARVPLRVPRGPGAPAATVSVLGLAAGTSHASVVTAVAGQAAGDTPDNPPASRHGGAAPRVGS